MNIQRLSLIHILLNIDEIQNGIVIDHIKAGTAVGLMDLLGIAGRCV